MSGSHSSVLCDVPLNNKQVPKRCAGPYTGDATQKLADYFLSNVPRATVENLAGALLASNTSVLPMSANKEDRIRYWRRIAKHYITSGSDVNRPNKMFEPLEPFYVVDLGQVVAQFARFHANLPKVRPHYAVKCNPSLALMRVIAALGGGFDCASHKEIRMVLDNGLGTPKDIIFANPVKMPHELTAARRLGVHCLTFDSQQELEKLAQYHPDADAVIRIKTNDGAARCAFSTKFGASLHDAPKLLERAKELQINVIGVSFHVGSGNNDPTAYTGSIRDARRVFDMAIEVGMAPLRLLDLGGGFPGVSPPCDNQGNPLCLSFEEIAAAMRPVLDECFGDLDVDIIAEPGRYFSAASHMLAINVFGARRVPLQPSERCNLRNYAKAAQESGGNSDDEEGVSDEFDETEEYQYYVSDGLYNSFNCIVFDQAHPELRIVDEDEDEDAEDDNATKSKSTESDGDEDQATTFCKSACPRTNILHRNINSSNSPTTRRSRHVDAHAGLAQQQQQQQQQRLHLQREEAVENTGCANMSDSAETAMEEGLQSALEESHHHNQRCRERKQRPLRVTTIFGPTCDSLDCIVKKQVCPELVVGDWLFFPDMGSYTVSASCGFNGFETRRVQYICSLALQDELLHILENSVARSQGIPMSMQQAMLASAAATALGGGSCSLTYASPILEEGRSRSHACSIPESFSVSPLATAASGNSYGHHNHGTSNSNGFLMTFNNKLLMAESLQQNNEASTALSTCSGTVDDDNYML